MTLNILSLIEIIKGKLYVERELAEAAPQQECCLCGHASETQLLHHAHTAEVHTGCVART